MPKIKCDYCSNIIKRNKYWIDRTKHHFCDRKCFKLYMRDHPNEFVNTSHTPQLRMLLALAEKK